MGSAARSRNAPTSASGPAAKAAALTREEPDVPYEDEDFAEEEPPRRSPWPVIVAVGRLVALLAGVLWAGYAWSQRQFYVGSDGTHVVVYQGLSQDLGPISLSSPVEVTDVEIADLPEVTRQQVEATITTADRQSAEQVVGRLEQAAVTDVPVDPQGTTAPSDGSDSGEAG